MAVEEPAGANWWNRLRTQTGFESQEEEPQTLLQQLDEATTLSRMQVRADDLKAWAGSIAEAAQFAKQCVKRVLIWFAEDIWLCNLSWDWSGLWLPCE